MTSPVARSKTRWRQQADGRLRLTLRASATVLLVILTMTTACAGLIHECLGQDGRHGVDLAAGGRDPHVDRLVLHSDIFLLGHANLHHGAKSCVDRLLCVDALKPGGSSAGKPKPVPLALHESQTFALHTVCSPFTRHRVDLPDPQLKALRTIVLLN